MNLVARNLTIDWPEPGRYVVAVSGGSDSVALLHLMAATQLTRNYELVVAHFNHGLRPESNADAEFVKHLSQLLGLAYKFEKTKQKLGGEAEARAARYNFLERVKDSFSASAVLTAHHADDLIETSLLNLARGSGWEGIAPWRRQGVLRPLSRCRRSELRSYLASINCTWREDASNADTTNPRNWLRHCLLPAASVDLVQRYAEVMTEIKQAGETFNLLARDYLSLTEDCGRQMIEIDRQTLRSLDLTTASALLRCATSRLRPGLDLSRRTIQRASLFALTARPGQRWDLGGGLRLEVKPLMVRVLFGFDRLSGSK